MTAQYAIWRWAWRLFRLEWRQQLLILLLVTIATAATIAFSTANYARSPLAATSGSYGAANQAFTHSGGNPELLAENLEKIAAWFGETDTIKRSYVPLARAGTLVEIRGQNPDGVFSQPMLRLLEGRFPTTQSEIAVTDLLAEQLQLDIGDVLMMEAADYVVVGVVENPGDLRDEFILMAPAFVTPQIITILVTGTNAHFLAFPWPEEGLIKHEMFESTVTKIEEQTLSAAVAMVASGVGMIVVALTAATGFSIVAQRRRRQLGLLAAIGATEQHLRQVMVANGAIVGGIGGVVGAILGIFGWMAAVPYLEEAVLGARVERYDVLPWWLICCGIVLAIGTAAWSAWLPVRAVARVPIIVALSGQPDPPKPARRTIPGSIVLIVIALGCFFLTNLTDVAGIEGGLLFVGAATMVVSLMQLTPLALEWLGACAANLPIEIRLAWRDLARFQARAATALAAMSLTLGIAVTVVLIVAHEEQTADRGNLSDRQLLITEEGGRIREFVTLRNSAEIAQQRSQLAGVAAIFESVTIVPLQVAVDPAEPPRTGDNTLFRSAVQVGSGATTEQPGPLFVATPELLQQLGLDPQEIDPSIDILTIRDGDIGLRRGIEEQLVLRVMRLDLPAYRSAPTSLITVAALERQGWEAAHAGWFLVAERPIEPAQLAAIRRAADILGFNIESRDGFNLATLRTLRSGILIAVGLVALCMVAITVSLLQSERATDLRILTATGATTLACRTISAAMAGGLALLSAMLGTIIALTSLVTYFFTELETLRHVPLLQMGVVVVGIPLLAMLVGGVLGGHNIVDW
ncbi:MAG: hypothetical protein KDE28_07790 [Anaerolineales bacterium]|nr:hypothetical protein [Anaerolineales bacterium]